MGPSLNCLFGLTGSEVSDTVCSGSGGVALPGGEEPWFAERRQPEDTKLASQAYSRV